MSYSSTQDHLYIDDHTSQNDPGTADHRLMTTKPYQGQMTTKPHQGQMTATPHQGQMTTTPSMGPVSTTPHFGPLITPNQGQMTTTPNQGQMTTTPDMEPLTTTPNQGHLSHVTTLEDLVDTPQDPDCRQNDSGLHTFDTDDQFENRTSERSLYNMSNNASYSREFTPLSGSPSTTQLPSIDTFTKSYGQSAMFSKSTESLSRSDQSGLTGPHGTINPGESSYNRMSAQSNQNPPVNRPETTQVPQNAPIKRTFYPSMTSTPSQSYVATQPVKPPIGTTNTPCLSARIPTPNQPTPFSKPPSLRSGPSFGTATPQGTFSKTPTQGQGPNVMMSAGPILKTSHPTIGKPGPYISHPSTGPIRSPSSALDYSSSGSEDPMAQRHGTVGQEGPRQEIRDTSSSTWSSGPASSRPSTASSVHVSRESTSTDALAGPSNHGNRSLDGTPNMPGSSRLPTRPNSEGPISFQRSLASSKHFSRDPEANRSKVSGPSIIQPGPSGSKVSGSSNNRPGPSGSKISGPSSIQSGPPSSRVSGPPSSRVSGPSSSRVSGPPSSRVSGPSSNRVSGPSSSRVSGPPSSRVSGPSSSRVSGPPSSRVSGPSSNRVSGPSSSRVSGPPSSRVSGPSSSRVSGPPSNRVSGPPSNRVSGPSSSRVSGPSSSRVSGPPSSRVSGPSSSRVSGPSSSRSGSSSSRTSDTEVSDSDMMQDDVTTVRQRQEDISDIDSQVYLSVVWQGGRLSVAYYDIDTMHIHLMLDTAENDNFTMLRRVLHQLKPIKVVASSKQDERLVKFLKQNVEREEEGLDKDDAEVLQFLPNIEFSVEICKRRLISLDLPSIPKHYTDPERTIHMSSLIPFDNICLVRAAGGLVKYLEKLRVGVELEDVDTRVPVLAVNIFTLEDQMILDDVSFSALQIFFREAHPSVYKSGSGSKEGLSLFGILNRCRSQIGSKLLRLWFVRPLRSRDLLVQRQEAVEFFTQARHIEVLTTLSDCLKHIKNIPRILARMVQAQASIGDWQALYKTSYHAIYIRDICRAQSQNLAIFRKISTSFTEALHKIATLISRIVDFEESAIQNHFVVKTGVDPELDEKKRTYNGLPDFMTKVAREELNRLSPDIVECNIIYLPQIGYLLAIPQTDHNKDNYEIDGLEFIFLSNNILHYRSASTRELDRLLGDTMCDITDHETSILHNLQDAILEHTDVLHAVMEYAAELDCLMSLATCAREFGYIRPELVTDSVIDIKGARHPLQELCCTPFVPNDYTSGVGGAGKVKVLTGPNACGKSVYLKQIALLVYMAQIGSFVPAESAVVGMVDRIFTRVKSLESVSIGLSTFMLDINQMSEALRAATESSLVIVDEFGKGTETIDGLSLLCSCLQYWLERGESCPHVLMSTHFHSLVHQKMLPRSDLLQYLTLETLHNGEELVFLYQVVEGHTTSSYASHAATQAGLPPNIVHRGSQVCDLLKQCKPVHRLDTADSSSQRNRCERIVERFLQLDMDKDDLKSFLNDFVLTVNRGEN